MNNTKKRIAILSVYDIYNYGSILQTYAMQKSISLLNFTNIIIRNDHRNKFSQLKRCFNLPLLKMKLNFLFRDLYIKYFNKELKYYFNSRNESFRKFIHEYLNISPDWGNKENIAKKIKDYNFALVGSDQVWNPTNIGKDFYTMNFIPYGIKKIAYASSFGVSQIPANMKNKYINFLSQIDCLSIRETSGQKIIKNLLNKEIPVVADPTILLPFKYWQEFKTNHPFNNKKYIFCYFLGTSEEHRNFVRRLKEKTGYQIVTLPHNDEICKSDFNFGDFIPNGVGPKEFVNFIAHANYICTDSFHATVFSNLFSKEFYAFPRFLNENKASTNTRIPSLLKILGNEKRYILPTTTITDDLLKPIQYSNIQENILKLREYSLQYLKDALNI